MAAGPMDYRTWLNYHRIPSSADNAKRWRAYRAQPRWHTPAPAAAPPPPPPVPPPPPPPPPPPAPPSWDPNYRDAQSISEIAGLTSERDRAIGAANRDWTLFSAEQDSYIPGIRREATQARDKNVSQAAARRMLRSGNRIENEGKINTAESESLGNITRALERGKFNRDSAIGSANTGYQNALNAVYSNAGQRRLADYYRQWGNG